MSAKIACVFLLAYICAAFAEPADFSPCEGVNADACTVNNVQITPCKKSSSCRFTRGIDAGISFNFTPNFSASKLKTRVVWANGQFEPPFSDLDPDACKFTTCPTEQSKSQQLDYNLHIGKKLPSGKYLIKWKVWNEDDESQVCCFKTNIEIRK